MYIFFECDLFIHSNDYVINFHNRYQHEVQEDGWLKQINNPEVRVIESVLTNDIMSRSRAQLEIVTRKLKEAYQGHDVGSMSTGGQISGVHSHFLHPSLQLLSKNCDMILLHNSDNG